MKRQHLSFRLAASFLVAIPNLTGAPPLSQSASPVAQTASRDASAIAVGQEAAGKKAQTIAHFQPDGPTQKNQGNPVDPRQIVVSARSAKIIGSSDRTFERISGWWPAAPNANRAKERVEKSFRKWGRFNIVEDETKADLIVVAVEGTRPTNTMGNRTNAPEAILYVFKGPAPLAKDAVPLWQREFVQGTWGIFRGKMPATVLAEEFRKDLESFETAIGTAAQSQLAQAENSAAERHFTRGSQLMSFFIRDTGAGVDHTVGGTLVNDTITEFRAALAYRPLDPEAHNNLGAALQISGDIDGAMTEYRQALRLKPDCAEAHANLGIALEETKQYDAAVIELRESLRLNTADPRAFQLGRDSDGRYLLARALEGKGDPNGAVAELREAVRLMPESAEAHFHLGETLERQGDKAGARDSFRQALALSPQNPQYRAKYEQLSRQD